MSGYALARHSAKSRSATLLAMAFVVELLVLELVHHFFISSHDVYKKLVGHRILELGEDGEKSLGHYHTTTQLPRDAMHATQQPTGRGSAQRSKLTAEHLADVSSSSSSIQEAQA